jgi:hypothetical protein
VDSKKLLPILNQNDYSNDLNTDNQKIQEELSKIDKQLNDMKVLNANLLVILTLIKKKIIYRFKKGHYYSSTKKE